MTAIVRLWAEGLLPAEDGVFHADGRSFSVGIVAGRPVAVKAFDLEGSLAEDPDWTSTVDVYAELELPDGAGFLCCGDGALGADGFFCRLDASRALLWACFLTSGNPYDTITLEGDSAIFTSTSGNTVTVNVDRPV